MLGTSRPADEQIIACLQESYGLAVAEIEYLPLGYDSYAGVYRVQADGQRYFLKVKADAADELSALLPRYLKENGIESVVAPLPTLTQQPWGQVDHFTLILYPFIDGISGDEAGLSDEQWTAFGAFLKQLHATRLPPDLLQRVPQETFVPHPHWMAVIRRLQADIGSRVYDHPIERRLAAYWQDHRHAITAVVDRAERLGRRLQSQSPAPALVLCHADIHTANLLLDGQGRLHVVDWDQPILAPRELDLMFVTVGAFVKDKRLEELFFRGYGPTDIDPLTMAFYRCERAMEDLAGFAERALLMDVDDAAKQDSVEWFVRILTEARHLPPVESVDG